MERNYSLLHLILTFRDEYKLLNSEMDLLLESLNISNSNKLYNINIEKFHNDDIRLYLEAYRKDSLINKLFYNDNKLYKKIPIYTSYKEISLDNINELKNINYDFFYKQLGKILSNKFVYSIDSNQFAYNNFINFRFDFDGINITSYNSKFLKNIIYNSKDDTLILIKKNIDLKTVTSSLNYKIETDLLNPYLINKLGCHRSKLIQIENKFDGEKCVFTFDDKPKSLKLIRK